MVLDDNLLSCFKAIQLTDLLIAYGIPDGLNVVLSSYNNAKPHPHPLLNLLVLPIAADDGLPDFGRLLARLVELGCKENLLETDHSTG